MTKPSSAASRPRNGRAASNASRTQPDIYLDGAHNPAGARELLKFWEENYAGRRIILVYGAMRDKAVDEIAGLLFPHAATVILTEPRQPRAISAPLLAEMTGHHAKRSARCPRPGEALEAAIELADPANAVFATGSLYLVGELRAYWRRRLANTLERGRRPICPPKVCRFLLQIRR